MEQKLREWITEQREQKKSVMHALELFTMLIMLLPFYYFFMFNSSIYPTFEMLTEELKD